MFFTFDQISVTSDQMFFTCEKIFFTCDGLTYIWNLSANKLNNPGVNLLNHLLMKFLKLTDDSMVNTLDCQSRCPGSGTFWDAFNGFPLN